MLTSNAVFADAPLGSVGNPTAEQIDDAATLRFPAHPHSGFSLAIVRDGRIVYESAYGYRDYGTPDRFGAASLNVYGADVRRGPARRVKGDANTIYEIGSVTKQFTAAAIVMLAERGKLSLDDRVGKYLTEFANDPLTLENLLQQRSGLAEFNVPSTIAALHQTPTRIPKWVAAQPRNFKAGAQFEYSNSNYVVLQAVAECVTREPLGDFLEANIFRPLGMKRTAFGRFAANDDAAVGYTIGDDAVERAYPWNLAWAGGAGAMTSTVHDLALWDIALAAGRVVNAKDLARMQTGPVSTRGAGRYGYGWVEDALDDHRYVWHNGEIGGFHAMNATFPNDHLAIVMLCNLDDAQPETLVGPIASLYFPLSFFALYAARSAVDPILQAFGMAGFAFVLGIAAIVFRRRSIWWGLLATTVATLAGLIVTLLAGIPAGLGAVTLAIVAYAYFTRAPKRA